MERTLKLWNFIGQKYTNAKTNMTTEYQRLGGRFPEEIEWQIRQLSWPKYRKPLPPNLQAEIKAVAFTYRCFTKEYQYFPLHNYYDYKTLRIVDGITSESYGWHGPRARKTRIPVRCGSECLRCSGKFCYLPNKFEINFESDWA